jgi:outer membrane protein OmpA-like peptidoglycan-associated protein
MATQVQDDYLGCGDYQSNTNNASAAYPGFITFQKNDDHYFAWVNGNQIVMRSEAYPDAEKMERGIKAILKNCDLPERYSIIEAEGGYCLVLFGGGNHQQHTGNRENHSEIGRSCPHPNKEALNDLLQFKGTAFADAVVPVTRTAEPIAAATTVAAAATNVAAAAAHVTTPKPAEIFAASTPTHSHPETATGGGMGWLKWLLPLLVIGAGIFFWKTCNSKHADVTTVVPKDSIQNIVAPAIPKVTVDTVTGIVNYELGEAGNLILPNGDTLRGVAKDGFENTLVNFIKNGTIDTVNKKLNWFTVHDVQFVTNKTEYANGRALQQIKNAAAILKAYPNVVLKIGGYTDISGDKAKNLDLSDRRAKQVLKDLLASGAAATQIKEAVGYGSEFAEAPLGDKEGMARDRKTAIKVSVK